MIQIWYSLLYVLLVGLPLQAKDPIVIGSKAFTENYILGEILAQTLEDHGFVVDRKLGMGGTGIVFGALENDEIDLYVEYTGTIAEFILGRPELRSDQDIREALIPQGLVTSRSFGFSNNYALALPLELATKYNIDSVSDLKSVDSKLRGAFSYEFVDRVDGFRSMQKHYSHSLVNQYKSMEHSLAYQAIENGETDVIDVYTTDAKIKTLNLKVLKDDLEFFPNYKAVVLAKTSFVERVPEAWKSLLALEGRLTPEIMQGLNGRVDIEGKSFAEAAAEHLGNNPSSLTNTLAKSLWRRTLEHSEMVGFTMLVASLIGIPLGILAFSRRRFGQAILLGSSLVQTIPSLALLCFLIPVFGIGKQPALVALFLYALLPVVVGTLTGLRGVERSLLEVADSLGFNFWQKFIKVELALASPSILSGLRTASIITVATATLAALIGAGGYGVPIVRGLAINDIGVILQGALPSAAMAIVIHLIFEVLERLLIPPPLLKPKD